MRKSEFRSLAIACFAIVFATSPALSTPMCGLDFKSPQQLQNVVAKKVKAPANLSDPEYQTYFDTAAAVAWAFSTQKNPAHPAVVCRAIVAEGKDVKVRLEVRCGADKSTCDAMVATWNRLNERMVRELKGTQQ